MVAFYIKNTRSKIGQLLHKSGHFDSDMHTTVYGNKFVCSYSLAVFASVFAGLWRKKSRLYCLNILAIGSVWICWVMKIFFSIHFQINNFVSSALIGESNATISTLTYSPKPEDHGRLLACQAFVEGIPGSIVEDSRRLHILCKFHFLLSRGLYIYGGFFISCTSEFK